jgi:hypothetical protein
MPYYTEITGFTNIYGASELEMAGTYGHKFKPVSLEDMVRFDGSSIVMASKEEGRGFIFAGIQQIWTMIMLYTMPCHVTHTLSATKADVQTEQHFLGAKKQPTQIQSGIQVQHDLQDANQQHKLGHKKGGT